MRLPSTQGVLVLPKDSVHAGCDSDSVLAQLWGVSVGEGTKLQKCLFQPSHTKRHFLSLSFCYEEKKARMPAVALGLWTGNHGAFVEDSGFVKL